MSVWKIAAFVVAAAVGIILLLWLVFYIGSCFMFPNPPLPTIRYGEFPFRLEYEINGERFIVEDTVICEFDGTELLFGAGYRALKWKSHLASGSEGSGVTLQIIDDTKKIVFTAGSPKYYMGYSGMTPNDYWHYALKVFLIERSDTREITLFPEQWYDEYNFKIISFEPSDPIQNTFK